MRHFLNFEAPDLSDVVEVLEIIITPFSGDFKPYYFHPNSLIDNYGKTQLI